ncbi:unnamed protein product, partial [Owenia fusiformis]
KLKSPMENIKIETTEMHTGGEPLRIVEKGYPKIEGSTILEKRRYAKEKLDHIRRFLMFEPRGHYDMYGAILVEPDVPEADIAVLFMHNEGYSTMCGHAVIALGRYAVDKKMVISTPPETAVNIQCPCGLVSVMVHQDGSVRFRSVSAFLFKKDVEIDVVGYGKKKVDISYGGAFYAFIDASEFGHCVKTSRNRDLVDIADAVSDAVKDQVTLSHPDSPDLAYLYGTILTDGKDLYSDTPTANICVFADRQVDRCPTGSGVTARIALQYAKNLIQLNQTRTFESGVNGSTFSGKAVEVTKCGQFDGVRVEVAGKGHYSGTASFVLEADDPISYGFLVK